MKTLALILSLLIGGTAAAQAPLRPVRPQPTVYIALTDSPASQQIHRALAADYDCGLLDTIKAEIVRDLDPKLLRVPDHWEHRPSIAVGRYAAWQPLPDVEQCEAAMWLLLFESVRDQLFAEYREDLRGYHRWRETYGDWEELPAVSPVPELVELTSLWGFVLEK